MQKQSYHHEDLKTELIQKGIFILNKEGYEGFSLRKVANACGVSQTAPYRHFKDKDELVIAITMQALREFNACLEKAVETYEGDPIKQLREMGVAYVHFFVENPEYLKLLFLSNIQDYADEELLLDINQKAGDPFITFQKAVKRCMEPAYGNSVSEEEMTLYSWGLVHGIAVLIASGQVSGDDCLIIADSVIRSEKFLK